MSFQPFVRRAVFGLLFGVALASVVAHAQEQVVALELRMAAPVLSDDMATAPAFCRGRDTPSGDALSLASASASAACSAPERTAPEKALALAQNESAAKGSQAGTLVGDEEMAPPPPLKSEAELAIRARGTGRYEIDGPYFDRRLADIEGLKKEARAGFHRQGVKVSSVRPDGVFAHLGIEAGDVITAVNGRGVESALKVFLLYESVRTADRITLTVERKGKRTRLRYHILR